MRTVLFFLALLVFIFPVHAQTCSNGVQDAGEDGVDCGFAACGIPCFQYAGKELTAPSNVELPPVPSEPSVPSQVPVESVAPVETQPAIPVPLESTLVPEPSAPTIPETVQQEIQSTPAIEEPGATPIGKAAEYATPITTVFKYGLYFILLLGIIGGGYYGYRYAGAKQKTQDVNQELLDYIRLCQAKLVPREQIVIKLEQAGYDKATIEQHFEKLR
ncbi:hypothetical protein HY639_03860 [Candidatus Woesearchaeota archaeon]|nr:hypothetical protein [Candidatus Woesearchaeota archaeon]